MTRSIASSVSFLLVALASFAPAHVSAQANPANGILPFSTRVGGIDSVDLATGSVLINIPVRNKLGKIPFSASLVMNSNVYKYQPKNSNTIVWEPSTGIGAEVQHFVHLYADVHTGNCSSGTEYQYNFNVVDEAGTYHPLDLSPHIRTPLNMIS